MSNRIDNSPRLLLIPRVSLPGPLKVAALCAAMCGIASGCTESDDSPMRPVPRDAPVKQSGPVSLPSTIVEGGAQPASIAPPPMPIKTLPKMSYTQAIGAAMKFAKVGDVEAALEMYSAAVVSDGGSARPYIESARLLMTHGRAGEARVFARIAVEKAPNSSYAWNTMGRALLAESDLEEAVLAFENGTDADSDNSYAWNNLGLTLMKLGHHDDAARALEEATSGARPTHYMWNNLGGAYEQLGKTDLAIAAFRRAKDLGSSNAVLNIARIEAAPELSDSDAEDLDEQGGLPEEGIE